MLAQRWNWLCDLCIVHPLPSLKTVIGSSKCLNYTESSEYHAGNVQLHVSESSACNIPSISLDINWCDCSNMKSQKQQCFKFQIRLWPNNAMRLLTKNSIYRPSSNGPRIWYLRKGSHDLDDGYPWWSMGEGPSFNSDFFFPFHIRC